MSGLPARVEAGGAVTFGPKRPGCCIACGTPVYEAGRMTEAGTQIEFVLSDGSEVAVTFCLADATALTPVDYDAMWAECVRATVEALPLDRPHDRHHCRILLGSKWLVGQVRRRREAEAGVLVVDRR